MYLLPALLFTFSLYAAFIELALYLVRVMQIKGDMEFLKNYNHNNFLLLYSFFLACIFHSFSILV